MIKYFPKFFFLVLFFSSCVSTKKYNQHIEQTIAVEQLLKDVDFVENKIQKLHPSADWYISKEALASKFDSIRSLITKPMTPNDFYLLISNPVTEVKQAHMAVYPLIKKQTKKETKALKKKGKGPFSQIKMIWYENELYVQENLSPDSTIVKGSKIIAFDGMTPQFIHNKYKNTFASDGFNKTWLPKKFNRSLSAYFTIENGIKDSINFQFSYKDSIFNKILFRKDKTKKEDDKKDEANAKDSLSLVVEKPKVDKLVLKRRKDSLRIVAKNRRIFGYDWNLKCFAKDFRINKEDSTVAVLKVTSFSKGKYKKAYKIIFDSIKKSNIQTLILDLRGNTGGSIEDSRLLFAYLAKEPFQFIQKSKVTSRKSIPFTAYRNLPLVGNIIMTPFKPIMSSILLAKTSKDSLGNTYFKIRSENISQPQENSFIGDLYVLIDGGSFSASCLLSSNLQGSKRGFFVGEETGGTYNGTVAGFMPVFKLPYSKLRLRIGLMDIRPVYQVSEEGRGIFPDQTIIPTIDNIINDEDVQLNWIIEQIKTKS
uniref:S41 family peptidase n=1 Tax=Flavobacterium sp. TaxID=239 RepID=UPI0040491F8E